jgi:hypothetical protein
MAKAADKQTMELIEKVQAKKAEIRKIERPVWKTNCSFPFIDGQQNTAVNVHVLCDVSKLVTIGAFLIDRSQSFFNAARRLGVDPCPAFVWNGFSVEDWFQDLSLRIDQIQLTAKKEALDKLEARLNAIISPELKQKMELDAIAAEVG